MNKNSQKYQRIKTPTVLQMEAVECGAASLAIVLGYFGCFVPLEKLRVECGVSRDGSKAANVLKAARKFGLIAKGYKYDPEDLMDLKLPLIVFWEFNHFLVVEGFSKDWIFLNDPAAGPRKVSHEEFNESFTGIVLTFETGPDFVKIGQKSNLLMELGKRLKGAEKPVIYALLTGLIMVIPGLLIPLFSKVFIDGILINKYDHYMGPLLLFMLFTGVILGVVTWFQQYCFLRMETKLSLHTSSKFFMHILKLPISFFDQRFAGDISSRVAINDTIAQLLSRQLSTNVINAFMVVFYLILMFIYDVRLTLIGIIITFLNVVLLKYISRRRVDGNLKLIQDKGKLVGTSISGLRYIETLKANGAESDFFTRWSGYFAKVINGEQELNFFTQFLSVGPPFLFAVNTVFILTLGSLRVMQGELTIGTLIAYQSLMALFVTPVNNLVNLGGTIQEIEGDMKRIDDVLSNSDDSSPEDKSKELNPEDMAKKLSGKVDLKNISFGYSPLDPPLISDFSIDINPGSRIAFVGPTGSGKSTLAKIICGLYDPWEGEILLDGKSIREIPEKIRANTVSMVDQTMMFFEGTIRENISMWDTTLDDMHIVKAAKDACIHDDITARNSGYDSKVEEGGRNFSGGQRQRIEIARALSTNPRILVLDEATSALDSYMESLIDTNLRKRGCTCIIIAHRLSTIRDSDEIIVLDNGRVVQRGTHDQLIAVEGAYKKLVQMY